MKRSSRVGRQKRQPSNGSLSSTSGAIAERGGADMATSKRISTPAERAKLPVHGKPVWEKVQGHRGLFLGYRRNASGGRWLVRRSIGSKRYKEQLLEALPDDAVVGKATGGTVITYSQA